MTNDFPLRIKSKLYTHYILLYMEPVTFPQSINQASTEIEIHPISLFLPDRLLALVTSIHNTSSIEFNNLVWLISDSSQLLVPIHLLDTNCICGVHYTV